MGSFFLVVGLLSFTLKKHHIRQDPDGVSLRGLALANGLLPLLVGIEYGSPGRTRTADKVVNSHLLYQLSYGRSCNAKISVFSGLSKVGAKLYTIVRANGKSKLLLGMRKDAK